MKEFSVYNMIFSSSATVYGSPKYLPIDEKHPVGGCTNPYGKTKYFIEEILQDICTAEKVGVNFNFKLPNVNTDYILPMNIIVSIYKRKWMFFIYCICILNFSSL